MPTIILLLKLIFEFIFHVVTFITINQFQIDGSQNFPSIPKKSSILVMHDEIFIFNLLVLNAINALLSKIITFCSFFLFLFEI